MKCSCIINDNYNFTIDYKKNYLLFKDNSEWYTEKHNQPLEEFDLEIINSKGESKFIKATVNGNTKINYSDLPCESSCKYDGIYTFKINNCGQDYSIIEPILNNINCSYSKLLVKTKPEDYLIKILPIMFEIEGIISNANFGLIDKAKEHMKVVEKMFINLDCKC